MLHIAAKKENIAVIKELISIKYPLNLAKNNGITAVSIASMKGNIDILDTLVKGGADLTITNRNGVGTLYLAIKSN